MQLTNTLSVSTALDLSLKLKNKYVYQYRGLKAAILVFNDKLNNQLN
jgi:hypothetical protein